MGGKSSKYASFDSRYEKRWKLRAKTIESDQQHKEKISNRFGIGLLSSENRFKKKQQAGKDYREYIQDKYNFDHQKSMRERSSRKKKSTPWYCCCSSK